jgi:hypothetical protein
MVYDTFRELKNKWSIYIKYDDISPDDTANCFLNHKITIIDKDDIKNNYSVNVKAYINKNEITVEAYIPDTFPDILTFYIQEYVDTITQSIKKYTYHNI